MTTLPPSYTTLPLTQIRLSHHPPSSPSVTPIIILTLYRPSNYNAFTDTMMAELVRVFDLFSVDPRVKCVVVTGHGRMFCAGADLESGFGERGGSAGTHRDGGGKVVLAINRCRKPVIAALNGSAVGVGITMTLPMSIRIAYKDAKIGFVFARRGLVMEACSSFFLPRLIGHSKAIHLTTTGSTYRASDRLLGDLFSEVLDTSEQVLPRALEIAEEVAKNTSTVSTYLMRELMYRGTSSPEATHLLDSRVIYDLFSRPDNKEGVDAFLQKREVKFTGNMERDAPTVWPWWDYVDTANRISPVAVESKAKL